mmetsp:Transcript_21662/g.3565  ORF Transcript_21662/g.3565 Transcript_21662/m.3565 type:complete len:114 (+) Transcript_21662:1045-1386(+)
MLLITLIFATVGFLSPAQRGNLITTMLLLFTFMGIFAGYTQSRLNKMFGNLHWKVNTLLTGLLIPGIAFSVFFIIDLCLELEGSSEAISFTTLLKLLFLWLGITLPLIYIGSL